MSEYFGKDVPKLGFGLMRLPRKALAMDIEQMEDNLSYMKRFQPLNEEEQQIIHQAQRILGHSAAIPCTACHYCTGGCPRQIAIPDIFAAMNRQLANGQMADA